MPDRIIAGFQWIRYHQNSFDGASENWSAMNQDLTLSLERNFAKRRSKNTHATAKGMEGQLANIGGQIMQNFMQSRKANNGKQKVYRLSELDDTKVKR